MTRLKHIPFISPQRGPDSEGGFVSEIIVPPDPPPWLRAAFKESGIKEVPGQAHTERIIIYHSTTTLKATSDEIPWCSSFVNFCFIECGMHGTNSAAAKSWLKWGVATEYRYGCVVVLKRVGGHHVAFAVDRAYGRIKCFGGNQGNEVKSSWFEESDVLGFRWAA